MIRFAHRSFGVLGSKGLGVTDLYGLPGSVEITTVSLENALGSVGGVTVGDEEVTDHQRLSGAGYVFSASACPFVSEAAVAGIGIMEREGKVSEDGWSEATAKAIYRLPI